MLGKISGMAMMDKFGLAFISVTNSSNSQALESVVGSLPALKGGSPVRKTTIFLRASLDPA
jgi:hypothetical protein